MCVCDIASQTSLAEERSTKSLPTSGYIKFSSEDTIMEISASHGSKGGSHKYPIFPLLFKKKLCQFGPFKKVLPSKVRDY